jgi:hypothetical protein
VQVGYPRGSQKRSYKADLYLRDDCKNLSNCVAQERLKELLVEYKVSPLTGTIIVRFAVLIDVVLVILQAADTTFPLLSSRVGDGGIVSDFELEFLPYR